MVYIYIYIYTLLLVYVRDRHTCGSMSSVSSVNVLRPLPMGFIRTLNDFEEEVNSTRKREVIMEVLTTTRDKRGVHDSERGKHQQESTRKMEERCTEAIRHVFDCARKKRTSPRKLTNAMMVFVSEDTAKMMAECWAEAAPELLIKTMADEDERRLMGAKTRVGFASVSSSSAAKEESGTKGEEGEDNDHESHAIQRNVKVVLELDIQGVEGIVRVPLSRAQLDALTSTKIHEMRAALGAVR